VASGTRTDFRLYVVAPVIGAVAGGLAYSHVRGSEHLNPAYVPE
jgi:hypothetical protein